MFKISSREREKGVVRTSYLKGNGEREVAFSYRALESGSFSKLKTRYKGSALPGFLHLTPKERAAQNNLAAIYSPLLSLLCRYYFLKHLESQPHNISLVCRVFSHMYLVAGCSRNCSLSWRQNTPLVRNTCGRLQFSLTNVCSQLLQTQHSLHSVRTLAKLKKSPIPEGSIRRIPAGHQSQGQGCIKQSWLQVWIWKFSSGTHVNGVEV